MVKTRTQAKKVQSVKEKTRSEPMKPEAPKKLVPIIIDKVNIRRKVANKKEYEHIDMKMYQYKNANVTVNKMREFVQGVTKKLEAQGLDIKVSTTIKIPLNNNKKFGWKSGRMTSGSAPIQVWTPAWGTDDKNADELDDWYDDGNGKVSDFDIFIQAIPKNKTKGGRDENNDCLYNALYKVLKETLTDKWKYANTFKKALGLKRDEMVDCAESMDQIESALNVAIFVEGDVKRTPKIKAKTSVHLVLSDNHYTVKKEKKAHQPTFSFKEKKPVFYHFDTKERLYYFYDGDCLQEEPYETFSERFKNSYQSDEYLLKCSNKNKLKEEYDEYVYNADKLKLITNGRINMYKTFTIVNTALKIFYDLIQHIDEPDTIDDNEAEFILGTYRGGILFHEKGEFTVSKGDVCSMYPSIMSSQVMMPYKKGEFQTITQEQLMSMKNKKGEIIFKCGIYHANITPNKESKTKLFSLKSKECEYKYFTHVDMQQALKLGFDINIIEDGKANFLFYPNESMLTAKNIFKHYVDFLFPLKQQHTDLAFIKRILNVLWGALCERRVSSKHTFCEGSTITLNENEEVTKVKKLHDELYVVECEEIGSRFKSGFARIGPFITSHGRKLIGNLALEHVDDYATIKRIYCDCILTTEQLKLTLKEECNLGEFGLEHDLQTVEIVDAKKVLNIET